MEIISIKRGEFARCVVTFRQPDQASPALNKTPVFIGVEIRVIREEDGKLESYHLNEATGADGESYTVYWQNPAGLWDPIEDFATLEEAQKLESTLWHTASEPGSIGSDFVVTVETIVGEHASISKNLVRATSGEQAKRKALLTLHASAEIDGKRVYWDGITCGSIGLFDQFGELAYRAKRVEAVTSNEAAILAKFL